MNHQIPTPRPAAKNGLHIQHWLSGLVTNRAATSTPFKYSFGQAIEYYDSLIDGQNMEITPANTLARRPGFPKYNPNAFSGTPKAFASAVLNGTAAASVGTLFRFLDTSTNVYTFDNSAALTNLYTKTTTLQTFFCQVGRWMYMSDGAVNQKTDGINVSNAGVVAPTQAPTVPNLNLYDSVGHTQTVHCWSPNAVYANSTASAQQFFLLDPTGCLQWAVVPAGTTLKSQSSAPNWAANYNTQGAVTIDGTMRWTNCGLVSNWAALTAYTNSTFVSNGVHSVSEALANTIATSGSTSINWQLNVNGADGVAPSTGTTGLSNTLKITGLGLAVPTGATIKGVIVQMAKTCNRANAVQDNTVQLLKANVAAGSNKAKSGSWPQTAHDFYQIYGTTTLLPGFTSAPVKVTYGGATDLWGTTLTPTDVNNSGFGFQVIVNVSSTRTTAAGIARPATVNGQHNPPRVIVYYTVAASDITGTFYGSVVNDSNGNMQICTTAGTSGSSTPSWATTIGSTTSDGSAVWTCIGTGAQLSALFSWTYAYSFHTLSPHTSTCSPLLQLMAPIIGPYVNLQGFGSGDSQVDSNDLYRTSDGGSLLFFDQSTPNVDASTAWTINDSSLDTDLNNQLVGPVANANDPPFAGNTMTAYHMGRMWSLNGNVLYFSAGPDCTNGDGLQAWPPANFFTLPSNGTALIPTTNGLVVFTAYDMFVVLGGPQLQTFWLQPVYRGFGVQSPNCVAAEGDTLYVWTSQQQLWELSDRGRTYLGHQVAPTLASLFPASSSYLAIHRGGQDQGLFICDGSANYMRFNMDTQSWDPKGTPAAGFGPIASIDTAIGTRTLVSAASSFIINRDPTTFQDSGSSYSAFATIGSIVLSQPGERPKSIESILLTSAAVGTALTLQVLPNEVSGSFTTLTNTFSDPPQLVASSTINMKAYPWSSVATPLANWVKHIQIKVTLPTEAFKNELYTVSIIPQGV